jgi:ASC-1-like (ASCH) protein
MNSIKVQQPYFDYIKNGVKTIEGRINKDKFASILPGDVIKIYDASSTNKFVSAYVKDVRRYDYFSQYLWYEGIEKTLPDIHMRDGCSVYYQYYTPEQETKYGILAIELYVIV